MRALLVYLAVEADHPHRRQSLAGLLWPESDQDRARHALVQTLYALRRDLGADVVTGAADLRLNAALVEWVVQYQNPTINAWPIPTAMLPPRIPLRRNPSAMPTSTMMIVTKGDARRP